MSKSKYKATDKGYKEEEAEAEEEVEVMPSGYKLLNAENMDIPYPELGHTVSQLSQFQEHKRKAILGDKDAEFCKKYHI